MNTMKKASISTKINKQEGFTLVEALVSITILTVALVAPILMAAKGISTANYTRQQLVASFLNQDAIEFIQYRMNTNVLQGNDHLDLLGDCTGGSCYVDSFADITSMCGGSCPDIEQDSVTKLFGYTAQGIHGNLEATPYNRELMIQGPVNDSLANPMQYEITATTTFGKADERHSFVQKQMIYTWRNAF